jgi:CheY-like chemotaxis protein
MDQREIALQARSLEQEETPTLPVRCPGATNVEPVPSPSVWVVDDSPTIRAVLALSFHRLQVSVRAFADGRDVCLYLLDHVQEGFPPLILLDLDMPGLDGISLLHILGQVIQRTQARTALVMMSARESAALRDRCRLAGAAAYLIKPIAWSTLQMITATYVYAQTGAAYV